MSDLPGHGAALQIEVWSDVICPWCYIGKRRLEQALASHDGPVLISHRAFQLDPSALSEGRRTVEVLAHKYQVSEQQASSMMASVTSAAAEVGLDYHLDQTRSGNTRDAHRLVLWAQEQGAAQPLLESMYAGYFTMGLPVFTVDDLLPFVAGVGLDTEQARAMLSSDALALQVQQDQQLASSLGASGVPFFVFNRAYGISGAQPLEVFQQTIAQASTP